MTNISDYRLPVHRSLLANDMLLGIGTNAAILLLVLTIVCMNIIGFWFIFISIALFIVLKIICKEDPYLIEILLTNLLEQDVYYG